MRIRVMSTGRVRMKRGDRGLRRYFADEWSDNTLPINVFLIEHPDGFCLVDTGQTADAARPGYFASWYPFFRLARFELGRKDEAAQQMAAAGVDPSQIRWVVLTHMHTDHVGGVAGFPDAEVLVARTEWEPAQGIAGQLRGYQPQHWPSAIKPHLIDFTGPGIGPFSSSYDLASDGSLLLVPLPGHTRGHAALLVRDGNGPSWLCAGDAAHTATELAEERRELDEWCRRENVIILTCHDDLAFQLIAGALPRP